ncbi:gibberellin 2-beta-dioxygenase 2-like [Nymphaea colorata]|nr:gibberellin 2-beta-dioxygenase 2-like [Nymphaea colorata]
MVAISKESNGSVSIPVIDMSAGEENVSELMVRACERFGFFKVVNHGVSCMKRMESEALSFFELPPYEKQRAGPPDPLGYGCGKIGFNGDAGELEYLLLPANPQSVDQRSRQICRRNPSQFSRVVNGYIKELRELACKILESLAQGLGLKERDVLSRFLRDEGNDSVFRLNRYPVCQEEAHLPAASQSKVGFGEHSDPQILSLLTSNNEPGLQICLRDGRWLPVSADPSSFFVLVGDCLQVLTNGRFESVRHRVMSSSKSRMSMVYFGAPSLHSRIFPLPPLVTQSNCKYRSFTWSEYKKTCYSLRLGQSRLGIYETN